MQIAIIGAGNILYKDDGFGVYAVKYLEENFIFPKNITLVDGGAIGFKLIEYCLTFDIVIILDTILTSDCSGTIYNMPSSEFLDITKTKHTAHEVEITTAIQMSMLCEKKADIFVVAITPKDIISIQIGLSKALEDRFFDFIDEVLATLKKLSITPVKKPKTKNLQEITALYA